MKQSKPGRVKAVVRWGALWHSRNRLDGLKEFLLFEVGEFIPALFTTRRKARAWIAKRYGYIAQRSDLRKEPHGWRLPRPVRVTITLANRPMRNKKEERQTRGGRAMNKKDVLGLLTESIAHWERMIAWVKDRNPDTTARATTMLDAINETWFLSYCPLCKAFRPQDCGGCPLGAAGYYCRNAGSALWRVAAARTWSEWWLQAQEMLRLLRETRTRWEKTADVYPWTRQDEAL